MLIEKIRRVKNSKKCNFEIEEELLKDFKKFREQNGISQKELINLCLDFGLKILK